MQKSQNLLVTKDEDESHFQAVEYINVADSEFNETSKEDPIVNMLAKLTMTPERKSKELRRL